MKKLSILTGLLCSFSVSTAMAITIFDTGTSGVQDNGETMGTAALTLDSVYGVNAISLPPGDANIIKLTQPVTDLDMSGSYTYMTWVKVIVPGSKGLITLGNCCSATDGSAREGYTMNIYSNGNMRYWGGSTPNNSNHNLYLTNAALNDGGWHHIAIRVQPGQVDIFFDGVLGATNSASNIPTAPSLASSDGLNGTTMVPKMGGDFIDGGANADVLMDEVRVYGSALSDQGIVDAMNNVGPLPDRLYYTFDGGAEPVPVPALTVPGLILLSGLAGFAGFRRLRRSAAA